MTDKRKSKRKTVRKKTTKKTGRKKPAEKVASEKRHEKTGTELNSYERREVLETDRRDKVEGRAYELFQQRGYMPGEDLSDWFTAERMIEEEQKREQESANPLERRKKSGKRRK
ncbi:MAG: DUF2934 domain-containing protein [Candidatus Omnitrophica bacterium]|nr:DUF2934 domain-containing protein [Candidatus Omnitrophota bacterium]